MTAKTVEEQQAQGGVSTPEDSLWFKDAIIYQLHVRAFHDSNADGIGDFRGLTEKLDYIQELGVTAIWLLPFFPSPLKDDGYDTADYTGVNPIYGSLDDFKNFLHEAGKRDLRVITEMVMNHTSDQHAWFQRARQAAPGSKWREYYVWSDTPDRYQDARIIFEDFEQSNWAWDSVAGAYYWHRFFHHQPDLNFDNPDVHDAMLTAIDFWMELGVDAFRLDAVPYLYQREGTSCENLPETHAFLKKVRQHVDENFSGKMLLAEANQWPEDAAAYFGDGDECHMNFHFPLMPRLFMAIEREDRFPVIDILEQTPTIPENCQWGIFLRNHDELTLEMVTDEERDYMYRAYAKDPRARVNLGIRRRLAPLLKNDRRRIELMNALLLSLPGTPIIYYGDELGMGDNIYLGDRDSVRTPMQWNADRNAGFSRANPQQLFLPPVIDAEYHFSTVNVEVEQNSPHSLLWWMRRIIGLRKQYPAFGRGSIEFLTPENSKVLTYLREYEGEVVLVVANLSRFAQCAELELSRFRGQTPIELFGQATFPTIGELPYFLTLGPHAFYWFSLAWKADEVDSVGVQIPSCELSGDWDNLFQGRARAKLEQVLPSYLKRQRWFAGKARVIQGAELIDVVRLPDRPDSAAMRLLFLQVNYVEGEPDHYLLPAVFAVGDQATNLVGDHPRAGILRLEDSGDQGTAVLCEAVWEAEFWQPLYGAIAKQHSLAGMHSEVQAEQSEHFERLTTAHADSAESATISLHAPLDEEHPAVSVHAGEQSNTSVVFGDRLIMKVFRRLTTGENPELEISRFLTEETDLRCVPKLAGALTYCPTRAGKSTNSLESRLSSGPVTIGIVHELITNEGDAWVYTLDELGRFMERAASETAHLDATNYELPRGSLLELAQHEPPEVVRELIGPYLQSASLLGKRTAEVHGALASGTEEAFLPEPFTQLYQRSLFQSLRTRARRAFELLRNQMSQLPAELQGRSKQLAAAEDEVLQRFRQLLDHRITAMRTRCHGDYHLGQLLFTGKDFVVIDFEGEPDRPASERRIKTSPLRDVAGMVRSFHYAAHAAKTGMAPGTFVHGEAGGDRGRWLEIWCGWCVAAFLKSYLVEIAEARILPGDPQQLRILFDSYLFEKALYELAYELNHRPLWVEIPIDGVLGLLQDAQPGVAGEGR